MTAEDQTWYLLALWRTIPLTVWAAWKAKYPWVTRGIRTHGSNLCPLYHSDMDGQSTAERRKATGTWRSTWKL